MNTDPDVEQILAAFSALRRASGDGPSTRKLLDALFRSVHNLKANASAQGLDELAGAAHQFEDVLHSLRTGKATETINAQLSVAIPAELWSSLKQDERHTLIQSLAEGAKLYLLQTSFDLSDFDRKFQDLKETLSKTGEVISTSPKVDDEHSETVNFRILYAARATAPVAPVPNVIIEDITPQGSLPAAAEPTIDISALEYSIEKLSAQMANLSTTLSEDPFARVLRAGRKAANTAGKEIDFELSGEDTFDDKTLANAIATPLVHLVRNAVDHGIEPTPERVKFRKAPRGKILIEITRLENRITVTVNDDGRGIDASLIDGYLLFRPGFSTATEASEISGRGVGLDVVQTTVQQLGGSISVSSTPGQGSRFEITFPLNPDPR
jgi:chemotaxis protein histidine kinase CheA